MFVIIILETDQKLMEFDQVSLISMHFGLDWIGLDCLMLLYFIEI